MPKYFGNLFLPQADLLGKNVMRFSGQANRQLEDSTERERFTIRIVRQIRQHMYIQKREHDERGRTRREKYGQAWPTDHTHVTAVVEK